MRVRMLRHGPSKGALALRRELGIKALRVVRTTFRPRPTDVILNWGCSQDPYNGDLMLHQWINHPASVREAQNKLSTLHQLSAAGVPTLEFTTGRGVARVWLADGSTIMVRHLLRASQGRGIEILSDPKQQIPEAPLYTRYFKGTHEYRIHVVGGQVVDKQEKRRRREHEGEILNEIRNLANGWVFCHEDVNPPECVLDASIRAVAALGLDFGAVDIKCNKGGTRCAVMEVNTAPGLEGTTLERYAAALGEMILQKRNENGRFE